MGEAKQREAATARAAQQLAGQVHVKLNGKQTMVVLELDLVNHFLKGVVSQLAGPLAEMEIADEVAKAMLHLSDARTRYIAAAGQKVVLATPADMPKVVT